MFLRYVFFPILIVAATLSVSPVTADICGYPERGTLTVSRKGQIVATFQVGVAETRDQYRRGLMGCENMDHGTGLLFIYSDAGRRVFWMKNTPLELAIIFASTNGDILAIERGEPNSKRRMRSPENVQYVLEINYIEAGELRIGDQISLRHDGG
jgi:uncharacterized membrane protein (UPF0127 family)